MQQFRQNFKGSWQNRANALEKSNIQLKDSSIDLIDLVWPTDERPAKPNSQIFIHELKYAG